MKLGLQYRFQVSLDHRLGDSVGYRRNSQRPRLSGLTPLVCQLGARAAESSCPNYIRFQIR